MSLQKRGYSTSMSIMPNMLRLPNTQPLRKSRSINFTARS